MPRANPKAKLEYDSTAEVKAVEQPPIPTPEPVSVPKEKKPRSQKQIDATLKMREGLKARKEQEYKIKEETKLEREFMDQEIKKKLKKLKDKEKVDKKVSKKVDEKIKEELYKTLKKKVPDTDSEDDGFTTSESEVELVIHKAKKHNGDFGTTISFV